MSPKQRFEKEILPHFAVAYNLARWLTQNEADAQDVLQEASIRAFRFFEQRNSTEPRPWFLQIVRNSAFTLLQTRGKYVAVDEPDVSDIAPTPEETLITKATASEVHRALDSLPAEYREVLILRELEEMSYEEISQITLCPIGTVMSRLSRGRARLLQIFKKGAKK